MDRREAATLLGMPRKEIRSVDENWIVTTDGSMHEVPEAGRVVDHWTRTNRATDTPPRYHPVYAEVESDDVDDEDDAVDEDGDGVPDGTAQQILEWVGDDKDRAVKALAAEQAKGPSARKVLVGALEKLAG